MVPCWCVLAASLAGAVEPISDPTVDARVPEDPPPTYEVSVRARYMSMPRGLMDVWFHNSDDVGWPTPGTDRPKMIGATYGLEFDFQKKDALGIFYVEFGQSFVGEGYWDDREDGQQVFVDGEWIRPSKLFGGVIIGIDGAYDAQIVKMTQTNGKFSLAFEVGGGVGIAVLVGKLDKWTLDTTYGTPAYLVYDTGVEPGRKDLKSPVWPMVDVNFGLKFNFANHAVLRLEGGLHDALYLGGALGGRF